MADKDEKETQLTGGVPAKTYTVEETTRIVEDRLKREQKVHEGEMSALIVENERLQKEQTKIKADAEAADKAELDTLIKTADPAVVALLPTWGTVRDQLGWLKKAVGENPAPSHAKLPNTPRPSGTEAKGKFNPLPIPKELA